MNEALIMHRLIVNGCAAVEAAATDGDVHRIAELEKNYSIAGFPFKVVKRQPPSPDVCLDV